MSDSDSVANGYGNDTPTDPLELRKDQPASLNGDQASDDDADLFGDGDDLPEQQSDDLQKLDDSELDSGDDEGRRDRIAPTVEEDVDEQEEEETREVRVMPAEIARISPPEADELYLLNMPSFLGLSQKRFEPHTYEPPIKGHGAVAIDANFSPFSTASTSLYWRRDPKDSGRLQSNSRIIRWSDGSLTLQIASSPKDQYKISAQALRQSFGKKNQKSGAQADYDPSKDAQFYLAAEHAQVPAVHQVVAPLDAVLKILPTGDQADESVLKLQQSLAAATNVHDPLTALKQVKEDPELAKKAAEMFEKDRLRSTRRRELAEEKLLSRKDRVLGRSGLGSGRGGLSITGLEDEDGMPTARGTKGKGGKSRRRMNRHGEIYSDDEDEDMPRGRTREDEYDLEDDFMAASDEEPEIYDESGKELDDEEDDPDVDDLEIEGRETVVQGKTRGGERDRDRERDRPRERTISRSRGVTPKRALDDEEDGERTGPGSPQARKKRRVIEDDDEDE